VALRLRLRALRLPRLVALRLRLQALRLRPRRLPRIRDLPPIDRGPPGDAGPSAILLSPNARVALTRAFSLGRPISLQAIDGFAPILTSVLDRLEGR